MLYNFKNHAKLEIKTDKGACKYYISMLGGWGPEGNAYFAYVVRGSRGKMLILLM